MLRREIAILREESHGTVTTAVDNPWERADGANYCPNCGSAYGWYARCSSCYQFAQIQGKRVIGSVVPRYHYSDLTKEEREFGDRKWRGDATSALCISCGWAFGFDPKIGRTICRRCLSAAGRHGLCRCGHAILPSNGPCPGCGGDWRHTRDVIGRGNGSWTQRILALRQQNFQPPARSSEPSSALQYAMRLGQGCSVSKCSGAHYAKGFCRVHYHRQSPHREHYLAYLKSWQRGNPDRMREYEKRKRVKRRLRMALVRSVRIQPRAGRVLRKIAALLSVARTIYGHGKRV